MPCPYDERILPISLGVSPCEICILSGSRKMACPPRRVIPASKELRVRVDEKKKSMKRVLSSSSREGRSSPHFILRSKARCRTVSSSSFVHSWVVIKSLPRKFVFIVGFPFPRLVGHDPCAGLSGERFADGFGHGDQGCAATLFDIADDGAYFGSHAAFGKVSFVVKASGLAERDGIQVLLVGFVEIKRGLLHGCRDEQEIGIQAGS